MGKVPEYNLRAINKYNSKFDRIAVNLPPGSKDRIKQLTGQSCNSFISALVLKQLDAIEAERSIGQEESFPMNPPEQDEQADDLPNWMKD